MLPMMTRFRGAGSSLNLLLVVLVVVVVAAAASSTPSAHRIRITTTPSDDDPKHRQQRRLPFQERPGDSALSLSRTKLDRWRLRWRHTRLHRVVPRAQANAHKQQQQQKHKQQRKLLQNQDGNSGRSFWWFGGEGTRLWLGRLPDEDLPDVISRLFGDDDIAAVAPGGTGPSCPGTTPVFNHNLVGMTNPCLRIGGVVWDHVGSEKPPPSSSSSSEASWSRLVIPASVSATRQVRRTIDPESSTAPIEGSGDGGPEGGVWWPGTPVRPSSHHKWKTITIRRRVGSGLECYRRVRDAALQWEFHSDDGNVGIVAPIPRGPQSPAGLVPPSASSSSSSTSLDDPDAFRPTRSNQVQQLWSGPGRRRLVTYAAQPSGRRKSDSSDDRGGPPRKSRSWLPPWRIVAFNPVGVVYDLVDQKGGGSGLLPDGTGCTTTTYTSTAYATLRGHWLQGEERVTVAWRHDGNAAAGGQGYVDVELLSFSRPSPSSWPGRLLWPLLGGLQERFFEAQVRALERAAQASPTDTLPPKSASSRLPPPLLLP